MFWILLISGVFLFGKHTLTGAIMQASRSFPVILENASLKFASTTEPINRLQFYLMKIGNKSNKAETAPLWGRPQEPPHLC